MNETGFDASLRAHERRWLEDEDPAAGLRLLLAQDLSIRETLAHPWLEKRDLRLAVGEHYQETGERELGEWILASTLAEDPPERLPAWVPREATSEVCRHRDEVESVLRRHANRLFESSSEEWLETPRNSARTFRDVFKENSRVTWTLAAGRLRGQVEVEEYRLAAPELYAHGVPPKLRPLVGDARVERLIHLGDPSCPERLRASFPRVRELVAVSGLAPWVRVFREQIVRLDTGALGASLPALAGEAWSKSTSTSKPPFRHERTMAARRPDSYARRNASR